MEKETALVKIVGMSASNLLPSGPALLLLKYYTSKIKTNDVSVLCAT